MYIVFTIIFVLGLMLLEDLLVTSKPSKNQSNASLAQFVTGIFMFLCFLGAGYFGYSILEGILTLVAFYLLFVLVSYSKTYHYVRNAVKIRDRDGNEMKRDFVTYLFELFSIV